VRDTGCQLPACPVVNAHLTPDHVNPSSTAAFSATYCGSSKLTNECWRTGQYAAAVAPASATAIRIAVRVRDRGVSGAVAGAGRRTIPNATLSRGERGEHQTRGEHRDTQTSIRRQVLQLAA